MKPAALSFLVYLIPIIGPHAAFVAAGLPLIHAKRDPLWAAADFASLLLLQAAVYLLLRKKLWFGLLGAPFAVVAANIWFSALLPVYFLIERDDKPIIGNQTPVCGVSDYWIEPVRAGASLELERAGVAWIAREGQPRYGLLNANCEIKPIEGPKNFPQEVIESIRPDGAVLTKPGNAPPPYKFLVRATPSPGHTEPRPSGSPHGPPRAAQYDESLLPNPNRSTEPRPSGSGPSPTNNPGDTKVWLEKTTAHVDDESFELQLPLPSSWSLLSYEAGEFLLARNEREVWTARKNEPARLFAKLDFGLATNSFRRVGDGYVYWEGYTEDPRAKLAWKLAKGSGRIEVPKGRFIASVSVNPEGTLIAVSVSSALNLGGRLDSVFVIDDATGREVWRRTADVWRAEISFVGNTRLAVTIDRRVDVFEVHQGNRERP